jgi:hypothetical protein
MYSMLSPNRRIFMATHSITDVHDGKVTEPQPGDSYQNLLADVMSEVNSGLAEMPAAERSGAIAQIHAIAENVRKRQEQSTGR